MSNITKDQLKELKRRWDQVVSEREPWESNWQEIADLVFTNRTFTTKYGQGQRRRRKIFDNTASRNLVRISSVFHGLFMNPVTQWFTFQPDNPDLRNNRNVRAYHQTVARRIRNFLNSPQVAFPQHAHESLMDILAFGTGPQTFVKEVNNEVDYQSRSLSSFYIEPDENGNPWGYFRKLCLTIAQIERKFPNATLPSSMQNKKGAQKTVTKHDVVHAVYPRADRDITGKRGVDKAFASYYFLPKQLTMQSEGGFDEVPFFTPRWFRASEEVYGRGMVGDIIADIAMLQQVRKTDIEAKEGAIRPPIVATAHGFEGNLLTHPGSINYVRQGIRPSDAFSTIQLGDPRISAETLAQERAGIDKGMMIDLLELPDLSRMTATEVLERTGQNIATLSPMLSRISAEWLDPMLGRCFSILHARGELPEAPEELEGEDIRPEYVSFIGSAQRQAESQNLSKALTSLAPFIQAKPEILDIFNEEGIAQHTIDVFNVPIETTNSPEQIAAIRQQRQDQENALAQAQIAETTASAAEKGSKAISNIQGAGL